MNKYINAYEKQEVVEEKLAGKFAIEQMKSVTKCIYLNSFFF